MYILMINKIITNSLTNDILNIECWCMGPLKHNTMRHPRSLSSECKSQDGWALQGLASNACISTHIKLKLKYTKLQQSALLFMFEAYLIVCLIALNVNSTMVLWGFWHGCHGKYWEGRKYFSHDAIM